LIHVFGEKGAPPFKPSLPPHPHQPSTRVCNIQTLLMKSETILWKIFESTKFSEPTDLAGKKEKYNSTSITYQLLKTRAYQ